MKYFITLRNLKTILLDFLKFVQNQNSGLPLTGQKVWF